MLSTFSDLNSAFDKAKGDVRCVVGYFGGKTKDPTYRDIQNRAESIC